MWLALLFFSLRLRLFQRSVLCHELLLPVIWETDGQLCILAVAFRSKDRPHPKFGVPDLRPDSPARASGGAHSVRCWGPTLPAALEKPLDARDGIDRIVPVRSRFPTQTRRTERLQKFLWDLAQETGRLRFLIGFASKGASLPGPGKGQAILRSGHAHITEPSFFLNPHRIVERELVGKQSFLHAHQEYSFEFQALGAVQSHQGYSRMFVVVTRGGNQRGVVQELRQRYALLFGFRSGIHQFLEVLNAVFGGRLILLLQ